MLNSPSVKAVFWLYNLCWRIALPVLRLNPRLAEGFEQRVLQRKLPAVDLWIQSASAGESYLAKELLKSLRPSFPVNVLMTTTTSQGMEILESAIASIDPNEQGVNAAAAYFPFDKPSIMEKAVRNIRPQVMVLLESEIWPGLLAALKKYGCKILIINGRITAKSLKRYLVWPSLWHSLRPDKILAISENDVNRFAAIFGTECVDLMPNMKFDRLSRGSPFSLKENPLHKIFRPGTPLTVLGSVRREEEFVVEKIIVDIHRRQSNIVIGLFPRHMHRINHWQKVLERLSIPWMLRSQIETYVPEGTVILWNTFGELPQAYELAAAAFVGGSLAPLGGQNFLEPLTFGVIPVIGQSWENFAWIGQEIVKKGLVRIAADWKETADILIENMKKPLPRQKIHDEALKYLKDRQGGTMRACRIINKFLKRATRQGAALNG